jgi:hypothetical protein
MKNRQRDRIVWSGEDMHSIGKMSVNAIIVPTSQIICNLEYTVLEELPSGTKMYVI